MSMITSATRFLVDKKLICRYNVLKLTTIHLVTNPGKPYIIYYFTHT
jgi:hypothetical protein